MLVTDPITPPMANVNEPSGQCTSGHAQKVGDEPVICKYQACFLGSSCVASMGKLSITFLVNEEFIPIKIEKLPDI